MDLPQTNQGGTSKAGGASMKRCPYCCAKNKSTFEYCVRCNELLDEAAPEGVIAQSRATLGKLLVGASLGLVTLLALALLMRSVSQKPELTTSPVAATRGTTAPRTMPLLIDPAINSKEVLAVFNAGLVAYSQEDYETAVQRFYEVGRKIPQNAMAFRYLGLSHFRLENFEDALDALAEARRISPNSYDLLDDFVTVAKAANTSERAIEDLRDFVGRHPDDLDVRLELARLARAVGDETEAMAQAEYLLSEDDQNPEFVYEYGVTLKEAGRFEEAKAVLRSSVEMDPNSAEAHHALGVTELVSGDARGAVEPLEAAVARDPENGDFRFSLAQAYEKSDRIAESLSTYEAYLEHAAASDARAKVVRERLAIAKKALAKRQTRGSLDGESL